MRESAGSRRHGDTKMQGRCQGAAAWGRATTPDEVTRVLPGKAAWNQPSGAHEGRPAGRWTGRAGVTPGVSEAAHDPILPPSVTKMSRVAGGPTRGSVGRHQGMG